MTPMKLKRGGTLLGLDKVLLLADESESSARLFRYVESVVYLLLGFSFVMCGDFYSTLFLSS
jgi:hypothetical protein